MAAITRDGPVLSVEGVVCGVVIEQKLVEPHLLEIQSAVFGVAIRTLGPANHQVAAMEART